MAQTYFKTEPCIVNIGLSHQSPDPVLINSMHEQLIKGLTVVAIEKATNIIAGVAINVSSQPSDCKKSADIAEKCEPGLARNLMKFFAFVCKKSNVWDIYKVPCLFECSHVSIHPDHQGQGLGKRLIRESWVLARDTGFRVFRIDCSSV